MELTQFLEQALKPENQAFFYNLGKDLVSSKELFLTIISDFPNNKNEDKKNVITQFYTYNPIEDEQDIDIIKSVLPYYKKSDIKNISGKNLHIQNINEIFQQKQTKNDIIKSFISALNKTKWTDQKAIDAIGEQIVKKINQTNIKIDLQTPAGLSLKEAIVSRMPSNILMIASNFENIPDDFNPFKNRIINVLRDDGFNATTFLNNYFQLKENKQEDVYNTILDNSDIENVLFHICYTEKNEHEDLFYKQRLEHLKQYYNEEIKPTNKTENFHEWAINNIQRRADKKTVLLHNADYLEKLSILIENDKLNNVIPINNSNNKNTLKI